MRRRSHWFSGLMMLGMIGAVDHGDVGAADRETRPREAAGRDGDAVLFSCDFESEAWYRRWGEPKAPANTALVAADPELGFQPRGGKALRIRVEQGGHYGASVTYRFQDQTGREPEEIFFGYDLRLADDWDPRRGGKLPGIAGTYGKAGWGGRPASGRDGWSARGLFDGQRDGKTPIGFYCYHADMRGRYGAHWLWDEPARLENNRWYAIGQYIKLNTPGENDGILRGWLDGQLVFEKTDVRFRDTESLKIETVWLNVYLGGTWTAETPHHLYVDNAVIARQPPAE